MTLDFLKSRGSSLLGLTLHGQRLQGVVVRRAKGSLQIEQAFEVTLTLDPLTNDAELVGREIRNRLDEAGVRESRCVVGVPLNWVLTLQTKLPDIPEADVGNFLNIQAERGFPYGPEDLSVSTSRYRSPKGEQYATLTAIPRNHLVLLEKVLRAARLKPLSFSLGITALQPASREESKNVLTLAIGENSIDLQVTCGGGVAALRALQGVWETEGNKRRIDADYLIRELRLTLGQLPEGFREAVTKMRLCGRADWVQSLTEEIAPSAQQIGLRVETRAVHPVNEAGAALPAPENWSPELALAVRVMTEETSDFEFLPPKISAWTEMTTRFSSRKVVWAGSSAGAAILLVVGVFLFQYWKLSSLEAKWRAIEPRVQEIEAMQQNIRKYRPWFDDSLRGLSILRKLTEAFPAEGIVSAKRLEIKESSIVSCFGSAQDSQALRKVLERLRETKSIEDVTFEQSQGKPLQFTFGFRWAEGGNREN